MIAARWTGAYPALLITLTAAGVAELVLLRLVYRIGLFVPRDGTFRAAYTGVTAIGSVAFEVASLVALALLGMLALSTWRQRRGTATVLAALFALAIAAAAVGGDELDAVRPAMALTAALAALALGIQASLETGRRASERAAAAAVALTIAVSQWATILGATTVPLDLALPARRAAELLAVVAAVALGAAAMRTRPDGLALLVAGIPAIAFASALAAQPHVTGILLLWGSGVTLALPAPVLVAALYVLLAAAVTELRRPGRWQRGLAILLLAVAGVAPQSTTHVVIGILALGLLAIDPQLVPPMTLTRMTLDGRIARAGR